MSGNKTLPPQKRQVWQPGGARSGWKNSCLSKKEILRQIEIMIQNVVNRLAWQTQMFLAK